MQYNEQQLKDSLIKILNIPSPTGYTDKIMSYIKEDLGSENIVFKETVKGALIISLTGKDDSNQRTFSAHVDTLGAMVRAIKSTGTLSLVPIGGYMMNAIDGENCTISTLNGDDFTGTAQSIKPSVHISGDDARNLKRSPENMEIILDEKVFSKEDVEKLGINVGDFISFCTRTRITEKGFVKSRYLDDKASVAILLFVIKYLVANKIQLPYTTNFYISNYEEVGHGARASLPENTKEFIAVDMGAPGLDQNSSEYCTCICANDSSGPYDYKLRKKLVDLCITNKIPYKIDVYPHYSSDASAALGSGWDIKTALIGPGVFASHAYERTHMDSILATVDLVLKYCVEN